MPDAAPLKAIKDRRDRLARRGGLYHWYERNAELTACVLRDMETHSLTREIGELRYGPSWPPMVRCWRRSERRQRVLLRLALSFSTWRTLAREAA